MIRLWRTEWFERTPPTEQVDFGNGHLVSADDILDGHFQQLTARSEQNQATSSFHPVTPEPDLHTKIEQVAPNLTPLTDLAENVAKTVPEAHPTIHFRHTLNQALTETHRQHNAQRVLGIRSSQPEPNGWRTVMIMALILLLVTIGVARYGQRLHRQEH